MYSMRQKRVTKFIAGLLALLMVISIVPIGNFFTVYAEKDSGQNIQLMDGFDDVPVSDFSGSPLNATISPSAVQVFAAEADTHSVTVNYDENGFAYADNEIVEDGDSVTITITPNDGYNIESVTINATDIELTGYNYEIEDETSYILDIDSVTEDITVEIEFSARPEISMEDSTVTWNDEDAIQKYNSATDAAIKVTTYIYEKDGSVTFETDKEGIRINGNTPGESYKSQTLEITESTLVEKIEVYSRKKWYVVELPEKIQIVIDKTAPVVTPDKSVMDWTKAETVTVSGIVIDEDTADNPSSGLSHVVWSKDTPMTSEEIIAEETNKIILEADGKFSFDSGSGEQNSTYYIYAVDVSGNISSAATVQVQIDRKNPTIEAFAYSISGTSIVDSPINFFRFGTLYKDTIYVTVTARDEDVSSGIAEITLYYGEEILETKDATDNSAIFELTEQQFKEGKEISAIATDVAGNSSDKTKPTDDGVDTKAKSDIVRIDGTKPEATISPDSAMYTNQDGERWYNGNLEMNVTVQDNNVGIHAVEIKLNGESLTEDIQGKFINADFSESNITSESFVINTSQNPVDGENVLEVVVKNNAGSEETFTQKVYIDTTAPDIEKFEIKDVGGNMLNKILNFLTFGIFFNVRVEVTVTAKDINASSGISSITLFVDGEEFDTKNAVDSKCTFTIPAEEITDSVKQFDKVLSAKAKDNTKWETETTVEPNTENSDIANSRLMIETVKPTIDVTFEDAASGKNNQTADENDWYKSDVAFTVIAEDADAGLRNVTITINDKELVNENLYETESHKEKYTVNTSKADRAADGSYLLNVTVTDNAGNVNDYTEKVYKDADTPYITGFDFEPAKYIEGSEMASTVEVTSYGFYFTNDTRVTISAKDAAPSSGVKYITYYTVDKEAGKSQEIAANVNAKGEINFVVKANFKGQIYAKATDNVGNTADDFVNPNSAIVEGEAKHRSEEHIAFAKDSTIYRTSDGSELYAKDVPVTITVTDTYSGIREIEWSVSAPYDTDKNQSGKVTVNNNRTVIGETDWRQIKTESNLVTEMQKTVTVRNNSNNIVLKVKMTDRAGNSSEKTMEFSIDKTAPVIEIVYDNNTPDEVYTDIFNANRTATITLRERNFNSSDVICTITNTDGVIPTLSAWQEHRNTENPDASYYTATVAYTADGDYTFDISYADRAKNNANLVGQHVFTIDKTMPTVSVSYKDNNGNDDEALNGNYYKADRIATITIVEHNFDASRVNVIGSATDDGATSAFPETSSWTDDGDTHTATIRYSEDALYSFDIEFLDKAGNSITDYVAEEFYVDKTPPTIEITGVADKSANNGTVAPVIKYYDKNFNKDNISLTLSGIHNGEVDYMGAYEDIMNGQTYTYVDFDKIQQVDDIYTLTASLTDMAGNETTKTIMFSVNRFGSVYTLTDIEDIMGKFLKAEKDVVIVETNVDELTRDSIKIKLTKNGTPSDLIEGTDYSVAVTGGNGQWTNYTYTIGKKLFEEDGRYSVAVYSEDKAGNINENIEESKKAEITFGIDKTDPLITPIDFESGKQYQDKKKDVSIEVKDNLVLEEVKIYLNGEEIKPTNDGDMYTFEVAESDDKQTVRVVAVDAAGNDEEKIIENFIVSTNRFVLWYNNTPLFIGSIIGSVVLALGITTFVLFFRKSKRKA